MTGLRPRAAAPTRPRPLLRRAGTGATASSERVLLLLLAAAGLLAPALGALVLQGRVLLHPCVSADGPLGQVGVRLALLTSASDCPEGTLAVTDAAANGAIVVLSVAAPVLVGHLLLAVSGAGLTALLVRAATSAGALLDAVLVRLPGRPSAAPTPLRRAVAPQPAVRPPGGRGPRAHPRRGPPLAFA